MVKIVETIYRGYEIYSCNLVEGYYFVEYDEEQVFFETVEDAESFIDKKLGYIVVEMG